MTHAISRRSALRGLGLATAAMTLAACSTTGGNGPGTSAAEGDLLTGARDAGVLRVAIGNEPPYTKMEGSTVTGAEPDVLRAVAKRLGIDEIEGVTTAYESMIPGLQAGRWDVVAAGLFMKQSRCSQVAYTEPVIVSTESFGVPPGNPKNITSIQDVLDDKSLKIGVLPGAFEEGILDTAGVPKSQWVSVPDGRGGVSAVKAGRADAFLLPTLSLEALAENDSGFEVTDVIEDAPKTGSGAAFPKGETEMVEAYNKELEEFKQTEEFDEIMEKWGFDPEPAKNTTSEELCKNEG